MSLQSIRLLQHIPWGDELISLCIHYVDSREKSFQEEQREKRETELIPGPLFFL